MSPRQSLPVIGRAFTMAAAVLVVAGMFDCAPFTPSTRNGSLDGTVFSRSAGPRIRVSLNDVMLGASGTYIDRLLADRDSTIERWPAHVGDPLRVWIDSSAGLGGVLAGYPAAVRFAFAQWAAVGIPLRFAYVAAPDDAEIRVHWTDHLARKTGSTTWRTDQAGDLTDGDITFATHISDGRLVDGRGMRAIALHEVGHALGLSHSLNGEDVMAPLVRVDTLSDADRNTIKLLYSLPSGPVR